MDWGHLPSSASTETLHVSSARGSLSRSEEGLPRRAEPSGVDPGDGHDVGSRASSLAAQNMSARNAARVTIHNAHHKREMLTSQVVSRISGDCQALLDAGRHRQ
jgi:hypothetical protein